MPRRSPCTIPEASPHPVSRRRRLAGLLTLGLLAMLPALQARAQFRGDLKYGLRLGLDLSRIPEHIFNPYRSDAEVLGDARVDSNLYVAAEAGYNRTDLNNAPVFNYQSSGVYLKAGIDYNLLKRSFPMESNMLYVGLRYGLARMRRSIPQYTISNAYWGNIQGSEPMKTLLPQWAEAILGIKVEVLNNLFLGWSLHVRVLTTPNVDPLVKPYLIPGYGVTSSGAVFDVNYAVSYRIPLWKPRAHAPAAHPHPLTGPSSTKK